MNANNTLASIYEEPLKKYLVASVIAHVVVVLFFAIKTFFTPVSEVIIRDSIRVDIVDLPDKPSTAAPPVKEPAKVETSKPPKVELKNNKDAKDVTKSQKKALEKLKALEAIEKLKNETAKKSDAKPKTFKGNFINEGDSLTGLDKLQFDEYYRKLKNHQKERWALPQWLTGANLKAQAVIYLDEGGNLINKQLTISSGNQVFDSKVIEALETASPFPAPPPRLVDSIKNYGIGLNFP